MSGRFVALMYHGVGEPAAAAEGARYTVTVPELERQLSLLDEARVRVLAPDGVEEHDGPAVALTFDDGEQSVLSSALPRLAGRGHRATLFMTTAWIGRPGFLSAAGLRELRDAGWRIGAHGHTHRFLSTLPAAELGDELRRSRDLLGEHLGEAPVELSFPGGRSSPLVEEVARSLGFRRFWSSRPGVNRAGERDVRRIAVRRGEDPGRFRKLVEGRRLTHLAEAAVMSSRGLARGLFGEDRYHRLTAAVLGALGRR